MLRQIKRGSLQILKKTGAFKLVRDSEWRRQRLLILCYHSTSVADEHLWRPALFMSLPQFEKRLDILLESASTVLPLGEALERLWSGTLPRASVALTFDDGTADFYTQVYPMLKSRGLPATVYQTTYYSDFQRPIFNLSCSYLLWQRRGSFFPAGKDLDLEEPMDLRTEASRHAIVLKLVHRSFEQDLTGTQKDEIVRRLARMLGVDYQQLVAKRILHLMTPAEISELAKAGVDFQLHTHRHRTPNDAALFKKEIEDNRDRLREETGKVGVDFCYPSGVYQPEFLPWLKEENIRSATTCDTSLASAQDNPLLLPRLVDTARRSDLDYESWLVGVGHILSQRRKSTQKYVPAGD